MKKIIILGLFLLSLMMVSGLNIVPTSGTYRAALGGSAGADQICQSEFGENYKALIGDSARDATHNWVLLPNTKYTRADGTVIGTTNSKSCFDFPLEDPISPELFSVWTGLSKDCTNDDTILDCEDWTRNFNIRGVVGDSSGKDQSSISKPNVVLGCDHNFNIYCAEQLPKIIPSSEPKGGESVGNKPQMINPVWIILAVIAIGAAVWIGIKIYPEGAKEKKKETKHKAPVHKKKK
jgi:hypothetical protein